MNEMPYLTELIKQRTLATKSLLDSEPFVKQDGLPVIPVKTGTQLMKEAKSLKPPKNTAKIKAERRLAILKYAMDHPMLSKSMLVTGAGGRRVTTYALVDELLDEKVLVINDRKVSLNSFVTNLHEAAAGNGGFTWES